MLLKLNIQLFASKKGVGSTKNGRDSEAKRLGAKASDGEVVQLVQFYTVKEVLSSSQAKMLVVVETILYMQRLLEQ